MKTWTIVTASLAATLAATMHSSSAGRPEPKITVDGQFRDWARVPAHTDPAHNDTDHNGRNDTPNHVNHPDVDILEYKFTHDRDNLYAYFKARGVIGRTQRAAANKTAGRYYAIVTIDVDDDDKTGYWLHEGGFYPTSGGYDVNAEIEWYDGRLNTGHYINHCCLNQAELDQAFLDQSSGRYIKGKHRVGLSRGRHAHLCARQGPADARHCSGSLVGGWPRAGDGNSPQKPFLSFC